MKDLYEILLYQHIEVGSDGGEVCIGLIHNLGYVLPVRAYSQDLIENTDKVPVH